MDVAIFKQLPAIGVVAEIDSYLGGCSHCKGLHYQGLLELQRGVFLRIHRAWVLRGRTSQEG